jgi:hypothetical protein
MRAPTRFHPNQARLQFDKKFQHLGSIQFLAQYRLPMIIHTVNLKDVLCQVNPNGSNLHGGRSFHLWGEATPNLALRCRFERGRPFQ